MNEINKVYIAGRVTGLPRDEAAKNFDRGMMHLLKKNSIYIELVELQELEKKE